MRIATAFALSIAPLMAGACTTTRTADVTAGEAVVAASGWRAIASAADAERLAGLDSSWAAARESVTARDRAALTRAGALLASDAALAHPALPPGSYRCRMTSLGRQPSGATVRVFAPFFCYVRAEAGGALSFTKQTGTDLPGGWLHADGDRRYVFLGARQRRPGDASLGYGVEPERDLAGVVERIGPMRWRLALPWREARAGFDVYELTPVPSDQQAAEPDA